MSRKMITALKRISNDIKALEKCPLEGIGLVSMGEDPLKFIINMQLMDGPYQGYKLQLLMSMTEDYPIKPPKVQIYPNQAIDSSYHHHIFNDYSSNGFKKFCIDFLDNEFNMDTNAEHTGWNPAYTISTILLQVQNFISIPDMHHPPKPEQVKRLLYSMESYKRTFRVKEGDKIVDITHTWNDPYPKMYFSNEPKNEIKMEVDCDIDARRKEAIKENLTCYLLRENYIDNKEILLGYPIIKSMATYGNNKIELYPIPQLLTYEAYQMQVQSSQSNNDNLINTFYSSNRSSGMKSANNTYFNTWLPIYVDENHYTKNRDTIINSIKAIKNEFEFKPEMIFDILPIILNKMIIGMFNGKSKISSAFIVCYFQYVLLFKRLCREYKTEYDAYVDKKIGLITMNDYEVNKKIIPDIGDFLMLTFLSNKDMTTPDMKRMKDVLIQEFLIRQVYWIFHGPDCMWTMRQKVVNASLKVSDDVYLDKFETDPNFKMIHLDIFNKELHHQKIYNQVINIISNDRDFLRNYRNNWKYAKSMAESRITQSFKKLYNEVSQWSRNKLRNLIRDNLHFSNFFEEDEGIIRGQLYDSFQVSDILKGNEQSHGIDDILKYAYESQKGNPLLLITFSVLKKLNEEGFMKTLEDDYGIFVKVDSFVDDIKKSLNEVKNYKELYECIGSELGNGKTELDLIIESYDMAKQKKYIREPSMANGNIHNIFGYNNRHGNGYGYGNHNRYNRRW